MAVLAVFAGGLLSASSPCVLAIMPMVIGYVGGHSQGDRRKALVYALLFALGLAITFTLLGAIMSQGRQPTLPNSSMRGRALGA